MTKTLTWIALSTIFLFSITISSAQELTYSKPTRQDSVIVFRDSLLIKKNLFKRITSYFEEAKKDKSQSKFDISFIGGPNYSVDTKLGLGLMASGLYRIDKHDLSLPPSDVAVYANITTSGFFSIGVQNTTIFPENKYRLNYDMNFKYLPTRFYGIGYEAVASGLYSRYDEYHLGLKFDLQRKILRNTYVGLIFSAQNIRSKNFEDISFKPDQNTTNTAIGWGLLASYDSRDFIPNASKGLFIQYEQTFFPAIFGNGNFFNAIKFTTRAYQNLWTNGLIAFDFNGEFNSRETPWTMISKLGGPRQMRGYFLGQYRDRNQLNSQVELRQKIHGRHGAALWGGAGNVFESTKKIDWSHTLPTYGLGYRWEFKNRVNVRLDYGFGRGQNGFYFNIYEAF